MDQLVFLVVIEGVLVATIFALAWLLPASARALMWFLWDSALKPGYWIWSVWHLPAVDVQSEEEPAYPSRGPLWVMQIVLSELSSQQAQIDALDGKLGVLFAVGAALVSFVGTNLVWTGDGAASGGIDLLAAAAGVALILSMVHSFWGIRLRRFYGTPETRTVRGQLLDLEYVEQDIQWAAITSIEEALGHNEVLLRPKAAAFRVAWGLLALGVTLTLLSAAVNGSPSSEGSEETHEPPAASAVARVAGSWG